MAVRQLALVPILIKCWGVPYYGEWLVISAIPSFLAMSNLGLGSSASAMIALGISRGKDERLGNVLATAWALISIIGLCTVLAVLLWYHFFPSTGSVISSKPWVLALLLISIFLKMLSQPIHGWWVGNQMAAKSLHLQNIFSIGELVIYLLVPFSGGNAFSMSVSLCLWTVAWLIYFFLSSKKAGFLLWRGDLFSIDKSIGRHLLGVGLGHQLSPLWQGLLFQGSLIMAESLLGASGAALWGALRVMVRAGNQIIELISQSLSPGIQFALGQKNFALARSYHSTGLVLSLVLSSAMCIGLWVFGPLLFKFWTHSKFEEPAVLWLIMPFTLIPFSLWWLSGEVQRAGNRPWALNLLGVGSALASLIISYSLFNKIGIISFALGSLVFEMIMAIFILPISLKMLNDSLGKSLFSGFSYLRNTIYSHLKKIYSKAW